MGAQSAQPAQLPSNKYKWKYNELKTNLEWKQQRKTESATNATREQQN